MSDQQTEQLNQDIDNTEVDSSEGSEQETEVEHEVVIIEEESSTPNDENKPFSNAAAAQRRVNEREERKTVAKENEKISQLELQNAEIMKQLQQQQTQQNVQGPAPTLQDCGFDQNLHTEAMVKWANIPATSNTNNSGGGQGDVNTAVSDAIAKYQNNLTAEQQSQVDNGKFDEHYVRASKLKVKDYIAAEEMAMKTMGDKLSQAIQLNIPNSEKILYHLGKNDQEAMRIKNLHDINPTQATIELGMLAGKLQVRPKRERSAEPETRLTGGTGGANQKNFPDTQQGNQLKRRAQKLKGSSWA